MATTPARKEFSPISMSRNDEPQISAVAASSPIRRARTRRRCFPSRSRSVAGAEAHPQSHHLTQKISFKPDQAGKTSFGVLGGLAADPHPPPPDEGSGTVLPNPPADERLKLGSYFRGGLVIHGRNGRPGSMTFAM